MKRNTRDSDCSLQAKPNRVKSNGRLDFLFISHGWVFVFLGRNGEGKGEN